MTYPKVFAGMGAAFTAALGNVDADISVRGGVVSVRGIFRKVRETDLLDVEAMGLEGIKYTFAAEGETLDGVRQTDTVTITGGDDPNLIGKVFEIAGHVDDGRAMKRLLLLDEG